MRKIFFLAILSISVTILIACKNHSEQTDFTSTIQEEPSINKDLTVPDFKQFISTKKGQLVDVRTPKEWQEGIIKGAIKINYYDKDFSTQITQLDKSQPVYVYCKAGGRSKKAAKKMQEMGFLIIYNLEDGIDAWIDANEETTVK